MWGRYLSFWAIAVLLRSHSPRNDTHTRTHTEQDTHTNTHTHTHTHINITDFESLMPESYQTLPALRPRTGRCGRGCSSGGSWETAQCPLSPSTGFHKELRNQTKMKTWLEPSLVRSSGTPFGIGVTHTAMTNHARKSHPHYHNKPCQEESPTLP